jgi:Nucleotidyl transferase AbiEii toxin, Type IV TA system
MSEGPTTPEAMRASVTARLRTLASADPRLALSDLLRQWAYDRLLTRVFSGDEAERWVLKGAAALLVRLGPDTRHTRDVDLFNSSGDLAEAEEDLRDAVARDLGDFMHFGVGPSTPIGEVPVTRRLKITAFLGATEFASFPVDLVTNLNMTGEPDILGPLVRVDIPGVATVQYRVYPVTDHVADKVCAIHELHDREDGTADASTRYRDLVDLAVLARTTRFESGTLLEAVRAEAERRQLDLPGRLTIPTGSDWVAGYAREVKNAPAILDRNLESAVSLVASFIDPILSGKPHGSWDPDGLSWS